MCPVGRDRFTGWGTLDVESALDRLAKGPLPPVDHYEPNDNAGPWAHALPPLPRTIEATLDYWDDNLDVYRDLPPEGQRLFARVTPEVTGDDGMSVWAPGTQRVDGLDGRRCSSRSRGSSGCRRASGIGRPSTGRYYLELKLAHPTRNPLVYRLAVAHS